ncbi:hypothetical protein OIE63_06950 [Streptomyces sp. NBC_01795]|uniref:hypothetical protein n=1 Tax=Streptomyces sp. NBC_01795 TaxID=2975943 RepID=UPI002DDAC15B|nr:hypothetical protein [Streptomyces sp. NBC_01795]WSA91316.1 hypothetical protein OIE63_06950 [Streptomyces sp. NBC_01795]
MTVYVCSLITTAPQTIPGNGGYHVVHFPFGGGESYDMHGMHQVQQPDGATVGDWKRDDRSGLIWPHVDGWGSLTAVVQWEDGSYSELRDRFVRDPLGLSTGADSTATDHHAPSPGMQCFTKHHEIFVHPSTPIAFLVGHGGSTSRRITHAQFKLAIHV